MDYRIAELEIRDLTRRLDDANHAIKWLFIIGMISLIMNAALIIALIINWVT